MTRPFFSRDRISDFAIFAHHADIAVSRLAERLREGCAVDFQDTASRFTLDSATDFLFGACVNSLDAGLPYPDNHRPLVSDADSASSSEQFSRAFGNAQWDIVTRLRLGALWPLAEMWEDRTKKSMEILNAFVEPILVEALRKRREHIEETGGESAKEGPLGEKTEENIADDETLLDHLVKLTDGASSLSILATSC